jgi:hypothetical protein
MVSAAAALLMCATAAPVVWAGPGQPKFRGASAPAAAGGEPQMRNDDVQVSARPPSGYDLDSLGPLKGLLGTWEGSLGLSVVRLPEVKHGGDGGKTAAFSTLVQNYTESVTFTPIFGAVLNRGYQDANQYDPAGQLNQTLLGVTYALQIYELDPAGQRGQLLHVENGQWLKQATPGVDKGWSFGRMALIPHGSAVIATGSSEARASAAEVKESMQGLQDAGGFSGFPSNQGFAPLGYGDLGGIPAGDPLSKLVQDMGEDGVNVEADELRVSSGDGAGSIAMLQNIKSQVFNEDFLLTLWIQRVRDGAGSQYEQLQYIQSVQLDFEAKFSPECESRVASSSRDCLIKWPHYQVNTLRKVEGYADAKEPSGSFPFIR